MFVSVYEVIQLCLLVLKECPFIGDVLWGLEARSPSPPEPAAPGVFSVWAACVPVFWPGLHCRGLAAGQGWPAAWDCCRYARDSSLWAAGFEEEWDCAGLLAEHASWP